MIAFIDEHRGVYGVEPICKVLPIAPSTYHAHVGRRAASGTLSRRAKRDEILKAQIQRVFEENFRIWRTSGSMVCARSGGSLAERALRSPGARWRG